MLSPSNGDRQAPKCMAYLLSHGNATVVAHANSVGAYFEVNKLVGLRTLIKRSIIGSGCVVGEKSNIQGSVIMEGSTIGKG
ncbi:hypothetical protein TELCIR_09628 [Teladorsagia circumcincta]|uniref:Bacterial transferase hexapeptide repeat protein n=1 Tax=Teladorsagia circumcincta TaxID=45464 RepID=A0A2G9UEC4_TELCI|nr:hypothetical protein TELCIR_09628 [Teladorsagia circumcincta]